MIRRRNRFGTILIVVITAGLLAAVVGTGAVAAAEEQSTTENDSMTVVEESANEATQDSTEITEQVDPDGAQSDALEDAFTALPEDPVAPLEDPFAAGLGWLDRLG
ncbi:hypothetical protein [Natrinema halophilum]|uniref:Uncharacterized protein n=1 Tax=Natrinema halophilum TaxID=1699371 RepID=A0A7D5KEE9_9EURY|nr:hypothetical protein [Natrinema halophilum]QLG50141.1 hypothetical protein HYG82_15400 [Natrinema halophilum]